MTKLHLIVDAGDLEDHDAASVGESNLGRRCGASLYTNQDLEFLLVFRKGLVNSKDFDAS
jgi:hypothetical protein